ncbi:hypothetical protein BLA29_000142 [Euroglyphus maynei]|uniref:Ionotropic glutamate receptor L-glutamate and glycine-binding domain-containing protein n=1 Tax=Euroglyphus maynei TaxID=6958 RepID=A0A1Y3BRF3_EURMA|nr:hypothetical protein BLA29_000142 [Euroglyphus maynei]
MRLNLQNETFAIGINAKPPYTMFSAKTMKLTRGSEAYFIDTLSSYFNFSFHLVNCKLTWGRKYSNGSWDGLIGLLVDKKIDIGIGGTFVDYDRFKAVSFLYPQIASSITFITAAPNRIISSHNLLFHPFPTNVWSSFLITLFICFIFDHIQRKFNPNKLNLFWISVVQLFHQDSYRKRIVPRNLSCYLIFWNFGSYILTIIYAGCLYSLIAAPSYSRTIDTVFELFSEIKSGHIILTSFNNPKYLNNFKDLYGDVSVDIDRYWKSVPTTFDGFDLVNDSANTELRYVYIGQRETLLFGQAEFGEKYLFLPEEVESSLFKEIIAIPLRSDFPYYDEFNKAQHRLYANGLMHHWTEKCYDKFKYKEIENKIVSAYEPKAFSIDQLNIFFMMKLNLQNKTLTVGVNESPPFVLFRTGTTELLVGTEARFLQTLGAHFNFSYELIDAKLNWGTRYSNGSWDGLIRLLIDKEIDIGIGGTFFEEDRYRSVPFLDHYSISSITFITEAPHILSAKLLFRPFQPSVWYAFIATLFICFLLDRIQRKFSETPLNLFWISIVQLFNQDPFRKLSKKRHFSLWLIFWNFGTFVLAIIYASCLSSLIAAPSYSKTIDTIQQLYSAIHSGQIIATSLKNTKTQEHFMKWMGDDNIDIDRVWQILPGAQVGFEMIKNKHQDNHYTYIGLRETLKFGQAFYGKEYFHLPENVFSSSLLTQILGIPVRPGFPYIKDFNEM